MRRIPDYLVLGLIVGAFCGCAPKLEGPREVRWYRKPPPAPRSGMTIHVARTGRAAEYEVGAANTEAAGWGEAGMTTWRAERNLSVDAFKHADHSGEPHEPVVVSGRWTEESVGLGIAGGTARIGSNNDGSATYGTTPD